MAAEAIGALYWYLEIDGITEGQFREVSGLDSENEIIEHRVSSKNGNIVIHKIPGALKFTNIVLRNGLTDDRRLHDWRKAIENGQVQTHRKNGTVTLFDPSNQPVAKYAFRNAWPCKLKGPSLDANKSEVAIEELELAHEGLERLQ